MIDQNPGSGKGVTEIMKSFIKYVPTSQEGIQDPILVNGDQASVEKMIQAKFNMATSM